MKKNKTLVRDLLLIGVMLAGALFVSLHPAQKTAPGQKISLGSFIPAAFGDWQSQTFDTSEYKDKWQSINELLVREYYKRDPFGMRPYAARVSFVLEYSSDVRKNFSFHFPEGCHRAAGNEIEFQKPVEIPLGGGKSIKAKCLFIKGRSNSIEKSDKIVSYWLVLDGKQYHKTFFIKIDQMLAGLLTQSKQGFLVRVDFEDGFKYSPEGLAKAAAVTQEFLSDLYRALGDKERLMVFGANSV